MMSFTQDPAVMGGKLPTLLHALRPFAAELGAGVLIVVDARCARARVLPLRDAGPAGATPAPPPP